MRFFLFLFFILVTPFSKAQNFNTYFTGNSQDVTTQAEGGICLMGGASEDDNAMKWFLEKANGGDVLVLRTSGSDGYNNYMFSSLGVTINSVETIVCNNAAASNESYIHEKIQKAEAIWFAGGNQWTYISYWRNSPIDSLIKIAINERNIVIGGTSAGMAIMGDYYFSAQNGTISSFSALQDPFNNALTIDTATFIENNALKDIITDTHFDNPDRKGRLVAFLSRIYVDYNVSAKAVACDEYTAVCIDNNGLAKVFGGYPQYDDFAYFVEVNCEILNPLPEYCNSGTPLTWNQNSQALKICKIPGTSNGNNIFNMNDWQSNTAYSWLNWSVVQGVFEESLGNPPNCISSILEEEHQNIIWRYNAAQNLLFIQSDLVDLTLCEFMLLDGLGKTIQFEQFTNKDGIRIYIKENLKGINFLRIKNDENTIYHLKLIQ
jgi:cyanophycinase-like exopeptidase